MGIWGGRRKKRREGEGNLNDERQTSFRFLPPLLVKRPILSVGWNLSDFSPSPLHLLLGPVACHSPPSLPFVSVFFCSGAHAAPASLAWLLREVSLVWRSRLALVLDVKVRAGKKKKKGASVFFNSASCDEQSVSRPLPPPPPPSTWPHPLLLSSLFPFAGDTVVKCNLGDRG